MSKKSRKQISRSKWERIASKPDVVYAKCEGCILTAVTMEHNPFLYEMILERHNTRKSYPKLIYDGFLYTRESGEDVKDTFWRYKLKPVDGYRIDWYYH